jgi:hypothetical protein
MFAIVFEPSVQAFPRHRARGRRTGPRVRPMAGLALTGAAVLLLASAAVYLLSPVEAAAPVPLPAASAIPVAPLDGWPPGGEWPAPREPLDTTPITPFETVGGLPYEP